MIKQVMNPLEKQSITRTILEDLPEWFGIESSREDYIKQSKDLPFFVYAVNEEVQGFLMLKETSKAAVEIACMGVLKAFHHQGIGRELFKFAENYAKNNGYKIMQVKTVAFGHYATYDKTNYFYQSLGFEPLEVFLNLWDEQNPCLIYLKSL